MLAKLRREFVAITMVLVGLVLLGVLGSSFASSAVTQRDLTRQALERALEGDVSGVRFGDSTGQDGPDVMLTVTLCAVPVVLLYQAWVYWTFAHKVTKDVLKDEHSY